MRTDIPEPHAETVMQSTVFLDEDGSYLGRRGPVDRQDVPLSQVPRHVQEAVIAAENRSFRTDTGIAPASIARAALATVTGGTPQGGSTITQQYVKNALLSPERSLTRKAREALIAVKLDRTRSKDEILEGYLNTVYFGRGAAGVESAARNYFGVPARQLTLSQGAALAAVINVPSYYERAGSDPEVTATLQERWTWILDAMADGGHITRAARAEARFPAFRFYPPGDTDGQRQYLIDAASAEAADRLGITEDELARGGYTVHTTFDLAAQDATAERVKHHQPDTAPGTRLHTTVVAMVPGDGAIRVLYGGADYARHPFNDAVDGAVEAGTALHPFTVTRLSPPLTALPRTPSPTPLHLTSAYATAAAGGTYARPYTITRITHAAKTLYTAHPRPRPAMTPTSAALITKAHATTPGVPATDATSGVHTTGTTSGFRATGGADNRTFWHIAYDTDLTLTTTLFTERPTRGKQPTNPGQLPDGSQKFAADLTTDTWAELAPPGRPDRLSASRTGSPVP